VTKTAISSAGHTFELQPPHKISRQAHDKLIPNAHPDLAAQWSTINDDAYSRVITNTAELCDPQVSTLFDLGYALDHASDDSKGIPGPLAIAATVTGTSRDTISFRMMVDDVAEIQHEDSQHEGHWLRIPSIGDAETTEWSQRGGPIQQICFARPVEGKTTWMAARLRRSIMIFRPILQREPVPAHITGTDTEAFSIPYRNSRLDANPVVELSENVTGGFTLADVTFNPRYPRQFGVVDIMGNWSVWEITGRQRKHGSTYAARKISMASLPSTDEKPQIERPRHDGWASIEWVAHFSTVVVSDRRCTVLYQMAGEDIRSSFVELGMEKQSEWVLDLQRSVQNPSHFFVLTTSRLLWFDVTALPPNPNDTRPALRPRITWRHFRDPEDTTLRISDLMVNRGMCF
jgi:RNA polymerase I-specific transcription initiation factor RRN6